MERGTAPALAGRGSRRSSRRAATRRPPHSGYAAEDAPPLVRSRRHVLRRRLRAADPADLRRRGLPRRPRPRERGREPLRGLPGRAGGRGLDRRRDPAGRPRPLPLLRGARAAVRRARLTPRSPSTTSAAPPGVDKRAGRLGLHAARAAADARAGPGRRRGLRRATCAASAARAIFTVGFCFGGSGSWARGRLAATGSPAPSASTAGRAG